jgi:hypothetical protein
MGTQRFLVMISERDEEKESGEERNDDDADRGSGKELEMEMPRAEKPRGGAAKQAPTNL